MNKTSPTSRLPVDPADPYPTPQWAQKAATFGAIYGMSGSQLKDVLAQTIDLAAVETRILATLDEQQLWGPNARMRKANQIIQITTHVIVRENNFRGELTPYHQLSAPLPITKRELAWLISKGVRFEHMQVDKMGRPTNRTIHAETKHGQIIEAYRKLDTHTGLRQRRRGRKQTLNLKLMPFFQHALVVGAGPATDHVIVYFEADVQMTFKAYLAALRSEL